MAAPQVLTDFTSILHKEEYEAISPSRPEVSQAGRTVLITGGSEGIGLGIAKAFITASAATVIIIGRNTERLSRAHKELEQVAKSQGKNTRILSESCDATDKKRVDALWAGFREDNITVDVLILNSFKPGVAQPLLELEEGELWSQFEANVRAPYDFAKKFYNQPGEESRALLYTSTMAINQFFDSQFVGAAARPSYIITKNSGTLLMQLIAKDVDPAKLQVISFHPGNIFTVPYAKAGFKEEEFPFEKVSLSGAFAVWAVSKEARYLHGRFVWAPWDVNELKGEELRKRLEDDPFYLRLGVDGLRGGFKV